MEDGVACEGPRLDPDRSLHGPGTGYDRDVDGVVGSLLPAVQHAGDGKHFCSCIGLGLTPPFLPCSEPQSGWRVCGRKACLPVVCEGGVRAKERAVDVMDLHRVLVQVSWMERLICTSGTADKEVSVGFPARHASAVHQPQQHKGEHHRRAPQRAHQRSLSGTQTRPQRSWGTGLGIGTG